MGNSREAELGGGGQLLHPLAVKAGPFCVTLGLGLKSWRRKTNNRFFCFNNRCLYENKRQLKATYFLIYFRGKSISEYSVPWDSDRKFSSALADQKENSYRVFDWFYKSKFNLLKKALITII